ncbi:MAG: 4-hydroxy-tetrahydrodipicolinate synthase [Capsulimonadaceae bacterium]|nr:4-hydroxy-tetrahydrodipicolinate synthase [Capsulimonadaceae bacterium]
MSNGPYFGRVVTAMATPFDENRRVDEPQAAALARWLVENGSDGLVIAGTTGESATLSHDEKVSLFTLVKNAVGDGACLIANTGTNDTRESIDLTRAAEDTGVDGILLVAPYYNKPTQEGLYQHFKAIASSTKLPVLLYNVPGRTITNILPATVKRLACDVPNILGIKEASSDLAQISQIARDAGRGFEVYSGEDGVTLPILSIGGVGVISVTSHVIGNDIRAMHDAFFAGDMDTARELHLKALPLTKALFSTTSPSPVKYALERMGVIKSGRVRLPLVELNADERRVVDAALAEYGVARAQRV